jgi:arginine decarboxylase
MLVPTPTKFYFACGSSEGFMPLNAFDGALMAAGVGNTNLVKMSSIVPPRCQEIEPVKLPFGALVPVAYASIASQVPGEMISAAVAACFPEDEDKPGLIMEYSARGHKEEVEQIVRNMAAEGMKMRGEKIKEIKSIAKEHRVEATGAVWAGVVLWF